MSRVARVNECGHPERKHVARGMCNSCFNAQKYLAHPKPVNIALCHPEREYCAKGLCTQCYDASRAKDPKRMENARKRSQVWYSKNHEKHAERVKQWRRDNPEKAKKIGRRSNRKLKYGITARQWEELFVAQNSCCALCGAIEPGTKHNWATDHDHVTKHVRAILCHNCNVVEGYIDKNESRIQKFIDHKVQHREAYVS